MSKVSKRMVASTVEKLAALRAAKAELDRQVKELELRFKETGEGLYESELHEANVFSFTRSSTDWKAIVALYDIPTKVIKKHTKVTNGLKITVRAKSKNK